MTKKESTRERILKSMYRLLSIHGYEKTALSMIAEETGIKKASIYYHFKSKEDIFLSVFEEMFTSERDKFDALEIREDNFKELLLELGYDFVDAYKDDDKLASVTLEFYIQSMRNNILEKKLKEIDIVFRAYIISFLSKGIEFGILDDKFDIELSTSLLFTIIQGIEMAIITDVHQNNKKVWEMAVECLYDKHKKIDVLRKA